MGCSSSKEASTHRETPRPSQPKTVTRQVPVIDEDHPAAEQFRQLDQLLAQDPQWLAQHPNLLGQSAAGRSERMMVALDETTPFKYTPLKEGEIRLVALHPGRGNAPLMCSLMTVRLDSGPQMEYEALSYAWGDPQGLHAVRCNNSALFTSDDGRVFQSFPFSSDESIKVSPNLKAALLRLRVDDDFRILWIDAICIDQINHVERSAQVQRMSEIYGCADSVLVWLGEEDKTTSSAFECIDRLNGMKDWLYKKYPNPDEAEELQTMGFQPWRLEPTSPGFLSQEQWSAYRTLLRKSTWFMRAWTLQEVVVAKEATVTCGSFSTSWDALVGACNVVSDFRMSDVDRALAYYNHGEDAYLMIEQVVQRGRTRLSKIAAYAADAAPQWREYFGNVQFESLLISTRLAEATDPRDKVYSLLSLARAQDPLPKVDYSLDVREIYLQVAKYWIRVNHNISMNIGAFLGAVQMANPKHRLPSWVVDWSSPPIASALARLESFAASGNTTLSVRFVSFVPAKPPRGSFKPAEVAFLDYQQGNATSFFPDKEVKPQYLDPEPSLCAKGLVLLTVKAASRRRTLSDTIKHLELMNAFADPYPTTSKPYVEIYPKVVNPQNPEDYRRPSEAGIAGFWEYVQSFEDKKVRAEQLEREDDDGNKKPIPPRQIRTKDQLQLPELFEAIGSMSGPFGMHSRSFFVTTNGFMGLGPNRTAEGDQICILYGCPCPFVIRPLSVAGRYWLVGECYVYGLSDGEAMDRLPPDKVQDLIFD